MKYVTSFLYTLILGSTSVYGQYALSKETIVPKAMELVELQRQRYYYPAGQNVKALVYQLNRRSVNSTRQNLEGILTIYYDEVAKKIIDSVNVQKESNRILRLNQLNDLILFRGFFELPQKYIRKTMDELSVGESLLKVQDIWIEKNGKSIKVKSYPEHYYDKDVNFQIGGFGKYIIVNTFVSEYLRSTKADSIITIFDVSNERSREIICKECITPQIIGNHIYYGKKFFYIKGADVYDWKIYRAPIFDLSKSELLGEYIELLFVSPDGNYLLGKKLLNGKQTLVILNIKTRKFQYILGRDYFKLKFFYSPAFKKMAFDREGDIIYIEYPKEFPFGSTGTDTKPQRLSKEETNRFWEKFVHPR